MKFAGTGADAGLKTALTGMVDSGRIPHAIMFSESDGGGAVGVAIAFLQYLFCHNHVDGDSCGTCPSCNRIAKLIHPDVHFIFPTTAQATSLSYAAEWRNLVLSNPGFTESELGEALGIEGKSSIIAVAEAKALLQTLSMSALEGGWKAVVIYLPEKMNAEAANRLLKAIEEPPELTQFILVTHSPEKVLQTIASRCQRIHVSINGTERRIEFSEPGLLHSLLDALAAHDLTAALDASDAIAAAGSRETLKIFCKYATQAARDIFLAQQGLGGLQAQNSEWAAYATKFKKTFPRQAMAAFDRANMLTERNVNAKLAFADLACKLFMIR